LSVCERAGAEADRHRPGVAFGGFDDVFRNPVVCSENGVLEVRRRDARLVLTGVGDGPVRPARAALGDRDLATFFVRHAY